MSCDWHIRCVDCNETHRFDDANHCDDDMRVLIKHAAALAGFVELQAELGDRFQITLACYGSIDASWFAKHRGHRLQPIDEYGRLDTQCHGYADCDAGHSHPCRLDLGHDGSHSARPRS